MARLATSLLLVGLAVAASATQFQDQSWYNTTTDEPWDEILHGKCQGELDSYLNGNVTVIEEHGRSPSALAAPVVSCLLRNADEQVKANMQSAGILLGLTPTVLAYLGSSPAETAALSVVGRRPALAALLALGSPAVTPNRPLRYPHVRDLLQAQSAYNIGFPHYQRPYQHVLVSLEYLLAAASIANLATLGWELGRFTIVSFAPEVDYLPLLWIFLAVAVHVFGVVTVRFRIHTSSEKTTRRSFRDKAQHAWDLERSTAGFHPRRPIGQHGAWGAACFLICSWMTAVGAVVHVLLGTLTLSSLLFISVWKAVQIVARFVASVLVCQAIVAYELRGMQHVHNHCDRALGGQCDLKMCQCGPGCSTLSQTSKFRITDTKPWPGFRPK